MKIAKTVLGCILLLFVGFVMLKVPALFCVTAVAVLVSLILVVIPKTRAATLIKVYQLVSLFISLKVGTLIFIVVGLWAAASVSEYLRSDVVKVQVGAEIQQRTPREYEKDLIVARSDYKQRVVKAAQNAFAILFDVSKTSGLDSSKSEVLLERMILFFVVWLLGGGVMISAMVEQFDKIRDCEFRLPKWMLKLVDHVVIFGWNSAVLSFLGQMDSKGNLIHRNRLVIVLTTSDSRLIRTQIDDIKGFNSANCLIYRCEYDDKSERTDSLQLKSSLLKAIYVAGEGQSSDHDSRAILLANELASKNKPIYCNIHDFGLANVAREEKSGGENGQAKGVTTGNQDMLLHKNVTPKCFYHDWAEYIKKDESFKAPFFIVGFGAMGKAVALAGIEKLPENTKNMEGNKKVQIFVSSLDQKKLDEEWNRFGIEFADKKDYIRQWNWDAFKEELKKPWGGNPTVVVTTRKGEKGMLAFAGLVKALGEKANYYLSQEIDGPSVGPNGGLRGLMIDGSSIKLFGMNRGAPWKTEEK